MAVVVLFVATEDVVLSGVDDFGSIAAGMTGPFVSMKSEIES